MGIRIEYEFAIDVNVVFQKWCNEN